MLNNIISKRANESAFNTTTQTVMTHRTFLDMTRWYKKWESSYCTFLSLPVLYTPSLPVKHCSFPVSLQPSRTVLKPDSTSRV